MSETTYAERTDGVDEKLRLLQGACQAREYDLAMSLAESLKDTLALERQRLGPADPPVLDAAEFARVEDLPAAWAAWARGWTWFKALRLVEPIGLARPAEPVDLAVAFPADQVTDPYRELRVARVEASSARLEETACQVYAVRRQGEQVRCRVVFFADVPAGGSRHYAIFYGNPWAERPAYPTDLRVRGEGVGLEIANQHYVARLSPQMGQLERLIYRREHGQELFAGGPGHGEPPGIDWAHDYTAAGHFQKLRLTNWSRCPNSEVIRGPLCVQVRRWGFPHSPLHPLFAPSRLHMDFTYTFFAGLPWFFKQGVMRVVKDVEVAALRDDEWVFSGFSFTDPLWLDAAGRVHEGPIAPGQEDGLQGIGYFNRHSRDAFVALWLELGAEPGPPLHRRATPNLYYRPHGHCWARYPLGGPQHLKAGAVLRQKNAYLVAPYFEPGGAAAIGQSRGDVQRGPVYSDEDGRSVVEKTRRQLLNPLNVQPAPLPRLSDAAAGFRLARPGEVEAEAPLKRAIWEALRDVPDAQFYTADANVVDLGYVCDVQVRADVVRVLVTMPHRGRPRFEIIGDPIRERLLQMPGVREVVVDFTWEPAWTMARLTAAGRQALGLSG